MAPRLRDVVVIVAFGVAGLVTLLQPWWGRDCLAADTVAEAVSRLVADGRLRAEPGDTVIVHPPWRDDVVTALRSRQVFQDDMPVSEAFTRRQGTPWPAVVVVAEGVHPWPAALEARRRALDVAVVEDDGLRVFRLAADAAPARGLDVAAAKVHVATAEGRTVACPWDPTKRRHVCRGLGPWMTVGPDTLAIAGKPETCTWSHPISGGRLIIDHGAVDLDAGLVLQGALSDAAADNARGAAVTYTLRLDDEERAITVHRRRGFERLEVPARAGRARVQLVVTTPHDGQRHTCHRLARGPG